MSVGSHCWFSNQVLVVVFTTRAFSWKACLEQGNGMLSLFFANDTLV